MRQLLKKNIYSYRYNTAFGEVINGCFLAKRKDPGTWMNHSLIDSFIRLHKLGYAISAEAYADNELVGGLYGLLLGKIFFGESMFTSQRNASKFAFIQLIRQLRAQGIALIDCQVYTDHLKSLGAEFISRKHFIETLQQNITT